MSYENNLKSLLEDNKKRIYNKKIDKNPKMDKLGEEIAKKLPNVEYDGFIDYSEYGKGKYLNFTDIKYGGSFMARNEKEAIERHKQLVKDFKAGKASI